LRRSTSKSSAADYVVLRVLRFRRLDSHPNRPLQYEADCDMGRRMLQDVTYFDYAQAF
jgi:hypothetical protein